MIFMSQMYIETRFFTTKLGLSEKNGLMCHVFFKQVVNVNNLNLNYNLLQL